MACAEIPKEDSFLSHIERVRVELKEKVSRAHQVLQERETALLSELQQLEDTYREGKRVEKQIDQLRITKEHNIATITYNENKDILIQSVALLDARMRELEDKLDTARDRMGRVELEWDGNLEEGILSMIRSIRVNVGPEYKAKENHVSRDHTTRLITDGNPTRGLNNLGSTCYMNCILQCLSHTLPLREFYVTDEYKQYLNDIKNRKGDLSSVFKRVMVDLWTSEYSINPSDLKKKIELITLNFPKYTQHDAHEFMRFLMNELHEEINRASVEGRTSPADNETLGEACARYLTWEDSRISELFSGMLRSEVCCSVCKNKSIVHISFMDIALPILEKNIETRYHHSSSFDPAVQLDNCLNIFITEEILIGEERPFCNVCRYLTESTKQMSIAKLPRFLIVQLKRFCDQQSRTKLSTPVEFDDTWRLKDGANKTHTYSLYGIVCHSGSIYGGHYTAYCNYNGVWRCFDDSVVSVVSGYHVQEQEAYLLFYKDVI